MASTQTSATPPDSGFSTVIFEKRDGVAWVTLNRPDKYNAYNVAMRDDLFQVLSAVHEDPEMRAMVLAGAGPAFSTGGDVSEFGQAPSPTAARSRWRSCATSQSPPTIRAFACPKRGSGWFPESPAPRPRRAVSNRGGP